MEHANSKILGRIAEIENFVLGGFVLDDRGNWVSIADKRASEEDFLVHLEAGRVLHGGQWVHFEDVKKAPARAHTDAPDVPSLAGSSPVPIPEDEPDSGEYPPETKAIQVLPPVLEIEETAVDPASGYAPETGLFVIDHPLDAGPVHPLHQELEKNPEEPPAMETKETKRIPAFAPPSIPSWEKEESRHKKHILIIGGVIVVLAGIIAIVAIMMQLLF
jgi:hypothetical protein